MAGRLPPETIRTRWEDGVLGFGAGALLGGVAALAAIQTLAPMPDSIFTHAKIWSYGIAHMVGINAGNWQSYSDYMQQLHAAGQPLAIPVRMSVTSISAAACACMLAWRFGKPRNSLIFHSGARVLRGKEALKAAEKGTGIEIAPGLVLTHKRESMHMLIAGSTGTGKSVVGWHVVLQYKKRGDRILLIDFKGFTENWPASNGDSIILSPTDRRSRVWAISKDIKTKQDARQLSAMFIIESKDPLWSNTSRQVLTGCILKLIKEKGVGKWGWRDIADLVSLGQIELKEIMEKYFPEGLRAVAEAGKTTDSVLLTLGGFMGIVYDLADAWENNLDGISIKDWFRNPDTKIRTIIMQISTEFSGLSAAFNAAIVNQIESCLSSVPDVPANKNAVCLFADEAPQLGAGLVKGWNNFLVVGRSKGLRVVMSVQSKSQLDEMAGDNLASTWIDSIGTKIIGSLDGEGAKWASELLGETVYLRPTYTVNTNGRESIQWAQQIEPTFKPSQVMGELGELERGAGVRMIIHGFKNRANVKILNTLIKYLPQFEYFKQPIELVIDFPFPKIGRKDRTPLRPQSVLADFCINPNELESQRAAEITAAAIATQNQVANKINEITETKEIIQIDQSETLEQELSKKEFEEKLNQEVLSHLSEALLNTSIVETALHIVEAVEQIENSEDGAPATIEHTKKRKIIRKKSTNEIEASQ